MYLQKLSNYDHLEANPYLSIKELIRSIPQLALLAVHHRVREPRYVTGRLPNLCNTDTATPI